MASGSGTGNVRYEPVSYDPPGSPPRQEYTGLLPPGSLGEDGTRQSTYSQSPSFGGRSALNSTYRDSEYDSVHGLRYDPAPGTGDAQDQPYRDDPNEFPLHDMSGEKRDMYAAPKTKSKRKLMIALVAIGGLLILVAAVIVPVYFAVIKPKQDRENEGSSGNSTGGHGGGGGNHGGNTPAKATWGADGSEVTMDDGTTFIYRNNFEGFWVFDPENPLNNSAKAQSYTPALDEPWNYGVDKMRGVNLGGWLNLEPFISPAMYERFFPDAVDEWTLCEQIQAADGNLDAIEEHYKTFITEEDFAMIAGAGLNWIRLPIAFWAIEVWPGEPYLEKVSWTYFLKAIEWARKYGLRINLDFHAMPGSQNGWNHSGRVGLGPNMLAGTMGYANAQRSLDYIRIFAEFISQPQYKDVVPMFGIMNEPNQIAHVDLENFYAEAYRIVRNAGGTGAGNGPFISIHHGMGSDFTAWPGYLAGADRMSIDGHPYFAFTPPRDLTTAEWIPQPCAWGGMWADASRNFGLSNAGEWSNAINDCGLYLNAVNEGTRWEGTYAPDPGPAHGSCDEWNNWDTWTDARKADFREFMMSSMDALQNYFFWTWKIGNSSATGKVETPFWSYRLAVEHGWAPLDPRDADGQCDRIGAPFDRFEGPLEPWQRGAQATVTIPTLDTYLWPPATIGGLDVATLPRYAPTGPIPTPPSPSYPEAQGVDLGDGWQNDDDTTLMSVPIEGCTYPDPWDAVNAAPPADPVCLGAGARRMVKRTSRRS